METNNFMTLIQSPERLKASDEKSLNDLIEKYPYFQAAHALHLKLLKQEDSFEFKKYLRRAALHTTNRSLLFDLIHKDLKEQLNTALKISKHQQESLEAEQKTLTPEQKIKQPSQEAVNQKINEKHSFTEWLMMSKLKPFEPEKTEKERSKIDLIETFIKNNPKISSASVASTAPVSTVKTAPSRQMMTETLANIYLEQKKYDKAIQAYNILILNNPKKSSFFADQIKKIESLQDNK